MNLTNFIRTVSREDFGEEFHHTAVWNPCLRTAGGRFLPAGGCLDFNPKICEASGAGVFRKIVRHELCHYHLYFEGKGCKHTDVDFRTLLKAIDGLRYTPTMPQKTERYLYRCQKCEQDYRRKRRVNTQKYHHEHCHGKPLEIENQEI